MREFHLDTAGPISDCAVLQVTGEVDVYTAPMLREQIQELAAKGAVHLIREWSSAGQAAAGALPVITVAGLRGAGGVLRVRRLDPG